MSKAKFSYLAGILDGEGCITIGAGQKETCINYNAIISVQNTSKKLIDWLQSRFGGQVYLSKKATEKTKPAWMWRLTQKKAIELLLLAVLPYLIIKQEQAKVLLSFVRLTPDANPETRAIYWQQLKMLNARGVSVTTNMQEAEFNQKYLKPALEQLVQEVHGLYDSAKIESELHGDMQSDPTVK